MRIVRRRHAAICSLEPPAGRPQGLRRKATAATAQALPTTAALTSRPSAHMETRRPTAINALRTTGALTDSRSGRSVTPRPTTATAAIRSRALTAPRPHVRPRKLIPHRAAAIQLRQAPTPHRAAAIRPRRALIPRRAAAIRAREALPPRRATALAEEAAAVGVVEEAEVVGVEAAEAAEARAAAEVPPLAGGTSLFSNSMAHPDLPGGPFVFRHQLQLKFPRP